jgi:lysine N6-hydroxylase
MLDFVGIGLGPFNLSLAALLHPHQSELSYQFFEQKSEFSWHNGMLLPNTTLQVPFMADLVSMVDPTSPFSFLNYLKQHDRLFNFYFLEKLHIPRREYNHYCHWVSQQLANISYQSRVLNIQPLDQGFMLTIDQAGAQHSVQCKHIVLGTGTVPATPQCLTQLMQDYPDRCFHSASFASHSHVVQQGNVVVLGAGQSAAEIFQSLFDQQQDAQEQLKYHIHWLTRAAGFFPMEYSALGLEHFTPDYTQYFYQLRQGVKDQLVPSQGLFYKGISFSTIGDIYERLYHRTIGLKDQGVSISGLSELVAAEVQQNRFVLCFQHTQQDREFEVVADYIISATGYQHRLPDCLGGLKAVLHLDEKQRLIIDQYYQVAHQANGKIFVQNAELHTHGIGTPDLGLGAYRAATIANQLLGHNAYSLSTQNTFQRFGGVYDTASIE